MKITAFKGLKGSMTADGLTQVVIYDDLGQPLMIASSPAPGIVVTSQVGEDNFARMLQELKLTAAVPKVRNA